MKSRKWLLAVVRYVAARAPAERLNPADKIFQKLCKIRGKVVLKQPLAHLFDQFRLNLAKGYPALHQVLEVGETQSCCAAGLMTAS